MHHLLARACAVAAAVSVAFVPLRAASDSLATVRIAVLGNSDSSAEPVYGEAAHIYKKYGLDTNITSISGGGAIIAAIAGGSIDVGFSNLVSAAAAIERGIPIVVLTPAAVFTSKEPDVLLVKARGAALKTGADLNGKTVAVTTLRGELQVGAAAWIDKNGGDSKSVHFVELAFSEMVVALKTYRIDAAMLSEPALTAGKSDVEELGDAFGAIAPDFIIGAFVASKSWAEKNPEIARRFVQATIETARYANSHHADTAKILAERSKLPASTIASMSRSLYGETLTAAMIQPPIDAAARYGALPKPLRAADIIAGAQPYWRDVKR